MILRPEMTSDNDAHAGPFCLGMVNDTAAGPLILDQFVDTSGTALTAHAIAPTNVPGTSWSQPNGTFTIQGNRAQWATSGSGGAQAICNSGQANGTVSCLINLASGGDGGVVVRHNGLTGSSAVFYMAQILTSSANLFALYEYSSSAFTLRASATVTVVSGTDYTVAAQVNGNSMSATVNGANTLSYGSASLNASSSNFGLRGNGGANTYANFEVTSP